MRHRMANRKLGRTSAHRGAMFRNQVASMIQNERIVTTLIKAKELRPIVEKFVTLGKEDSVHNRRQAAQSISDATLVQKLFNTLSPRFAQRPGGYTRIIKLGPRRGDGAEMAILEFVDYTLADKKAAPATGKKGAVTKKKGKAADDQAGSDAEGGEEKAKKKAKPEKKPKPAKKPKPEKKPKTVTPKAGKKSKAAATKSRTKRGA